MALTQKSGALWKTVELLAYSYYASKGYRVLVSMVDSPSYDLVTERNGEFKRVNVKVAGLKDKSEKNSWSIAVASGPSVKKQSAKDTVRSKGEVDKYLVWMPREKGFIEIDGDFFNGSGSKSKRIPASFFANIERVEI